MKTSRRTKLISLTLAAALAFSACGTTTTELTAATDTLEPATQTGTAPVDETAVVQDPAPPAATEPAPQAETAPQADIAVVNFDGEEMVFDFYICSAIGPEFMSVAGPLVSDASTELRVAYELPTDFDGENAEYDNTFSLIFGNDTWKAGTLENSSLGTGDETWGDLNWTRDGDTITGTATMVHSWGLDAENSEPKEATFVVGCAG